MHFVAGRAELLSGAVGVPGPPSSVDHTQAVDLFLDEVVALVGRERAARFDGGCVASTLGPMHLSALVTSLFAGPDWMSVVKAGHTLHPEAWTTPEGSPDPHRVHEAYRSGYTLVMRRMQMRVPEIAAVCRRLDRALLAANWLLRRPVRSNLFASPAGTVGLERHWDDHDVIVIQIHGEKQWTVHASAHRFPLAPPASTPSDDDVGEVVFDGCLVPGDVLFVPSGFAHRTSTDESSSLHITLGVELITWVDVLGAAAALRPELRQAVMPEMWTRMAGTPAAGPAPMHSLLRASLDDGVLRQAMCDLATGGLAKAGPLEVAADWDAPLAEIVRGSCFQRRSDSLSMHFELVDGVTVWVIPGLSLSAPGGMEGTFAFLHEVDEPFTAADLPAGVDEGFALALLAQLVRCGYLEVIERP